MTPPKYSGTLDLASGTRRCLRSAYRSCLVREIGRTGDVSRDHGLVSEEATPPAQVDEDETMATASRGGKSKSLKKPKSRSSTKSLRTLYNSLERSFKESSLSGADDNEEDGFRLVRKERAKEKPFKRPLSDNEKHDVTRLQIACRPSSAMHSADRAHRPQASPLELLEIVELVISLLDEDNMVPLEQAPVRRKPLSLQHAMLIYYPDTLRARRVWEEAKREEEAIARERHQTHEGSGAGVYACLTVNRLFYDAARRVLGRRATFSALSSWHNFVHTSSARPYPDLRTLVVHKVREANNDELFMIGEQRRLEWLEFHVCPHLYPTPEIIGPKLARLALPGCSLVDNDLLQYVGHHCPELSFLDLRACEKVSDDGLVSIAQGCPKLRYLNVGRVNFGFRVTSTSIEQIAIQTKINTLGAAGCLITDSAIRALAQHRGPWIERLSLNGCGLLSNDSIPKMVAHTPNLQVLELRGCVKITNVRPIVQFKQRHRHALVEGCVVFEQRMRKEEDRLEAQGMPHVGPPEQQQQQQQQQQQ